MSSSSSSLLFDPARASVVRDLLGSLDAAPNRLLGQNFLVDGGALDRIVATAQLRPDDAILEIGPGLGALTVRLLHATGRVSAIEKDAKFAAFLRNKLRAHGLQLIEGDALEIEWEQLGLPERDAVIVANLPYSISKPALRRILETWRPHLRSATVLVQREVAARLVAAPDTRDYGPMSIMATLYSRAQRVFDIAPEAFLPPPSVTSSVVHLALHAVPSIDLNDEAAFWRVVRAAFGQRRKNLGNALAPLGPREAVRSALESCGIDARRRGETLSPLEFETLARALFPDSSTKTTSDSSSAQGGD